MLKKIKYLLFITLIFTAISCSKNDANELTKQIIGEWLRSDFREDYEFKLMFHTDDTGFKTVKIGTMETEITSSIVTFNWSIDGDSITITENEEVVTSLVFINDKGELTLENYSEFSFIRIE